MPRLIDADALMEEIEFEYDLNYGEILTDPRKFADMVEDSLTVDAVEVVHGEWSRLEDDYCGLIALVCSKCNREYWFEDEPPMKIYNYCPNCGAKMDGDGNG